MYPTIIKEAEIKITTALAQITESLRRPTRPGWAQMNIVSQVRAATHTMNSIITSIFTQNPKFKPITQLKLSEQLLLAKACNAFSGLLSTAAVMNLNKVQANKADFNKKIITAHKFFAAILMCIYKMQDQQSMQKKHLKQLLKYLHQLEKKAQAETHQYQPGDLVKAPIPPAHKAPWLHLDPSKDEDVLILLEILDLTIGATHQEIEQAFNELQNELTPENNPERYAAVFFAFTHLMMVSSSRLADLANTKPHEIQFFADKLKPQLPELLNDDTSLQELREAYTKSLSSETLSPQETNRMHLTMKQLEKEFGNNPTEKFNLSEKLEAPTLSRLGQTPRPKPPNFKDKG